MYYLSNGQLSTDKVVFQSGISGYIVATIESCFGYQSCLICAKSKTLVSSNFRFDKQEAIEISEKTFNKLIAEVFGKQSKSA